MFDPFTISLGVSAVGAAASWWSRQEQARQQRRETEEAVRRLRKQHAYTLGESRARGAASGVEFESESLQRYLSEMSLEFSREEEWLRRSGARQADATSLSSNLGLFSDLGGAVFSYGQSNNWWKKR